MTIQLNIVQCLQENHNWLVGLTLTVTTYLYGSLDNEIYMKNLEGFKMLEACKNSWEIYLIRLHKSLYGLKQSGHMWYN